jgi:hypothetical protein
MVNDGIGPPRMSLSHGRTTLAIVEKAKRRAAPVDCPRLEANRSVSEPNLARVSLSPT